jgi:hypothetical protein
MINFICEYYFIKKGNFFMLPLKHLSPADEELLLKKLNASGKVTIVVQKNSHLRFYDADKYYAYRQQMHHVIQGHKPWIKRRKPILGPIGSKPLGIKGDIRRQSIYEGR